MHFEDLKSAETPFRLASEVLLSLKSVTFRYKKELDSHGNPQFGLVAKQVEKVDPDLVARDNQGKPYSVRYEAVNAMLLNEFLKAYNKVEEQQSTIGELKSVVAAQQKELKALREGLHEVDHQLELINSGGRVIAGK